MSIFIMYQYFLVVDVYTTIHRKVNNTPFYKNTLLFELIITSVSFLNSLNLSSNLKQFMYHNSHITT